MAAADEEWAQAWDQLLHDAITWAVCWICGWPAAHHRHPAVRGFHKRKLADLYPIRQITRIPSHNSR